MCTVWSVMGNVGNAEGWSSKEFFYLLAATFFTVGGLFDKSKKPAVMSDSDNEVCLCCLCLDGLVFARTASSVISFLFHFRLLGIRFSNCLLAIRVVCFCLLLLPFVKLRSEKTYRPSSSFTHRIWFVYMSRSFLYIWSFPLCVWYMYIIRN